MSFNGADSAPGGGSLNPATNLGDTPPGERHDITAGDVAVIVGAVAALVLFVTGVLWYRLRRMRTTAADADGEVVEMEEGAVATAGGGDGGLDKKETDWKVMAWKDGKSKEEEGGDKGAAVGGKDDTHHTNDTAAYHAV